MPLVCLRRILRPPCVRSGHDLGIGTLICIRLTAVSSTKNAVFPSVHLRLVVSPRYFSVMHLKMFLPSSLNVIAVLSIDITTKPRRDEANELLSL